MSNSNIKGYLITLEGIDGCGKSTQAQLLATQLQERGYQVVLTREPGGTPLAEAIRQLILTPSPERLEPLAEILLYAASRAQHVQKLIRPALAAGKLVVCERFIDSSLAYQGYGLGRDLEVIRAVNRAAVGELQPDLTLLLDLKLTHSRQRLNSRTQANGTGHDRIEQRGPAFQERVRRGFLALAQQEQRWVVLDANRKSVAAVHQEIMAAVTTRLQLR